MRSIWKNIESVVAVFTCSIKSSIYICFYDAFTYFESYYVLILPWTCGHVYRVLILHAINWLRNEADYKIKPRIENKRIVESQDESDGRIL
jgi:hypothetical protein